MHGRDGQSCSMSLSNRNPFHELLATPEPALLGPESRAGVLEREELTTKIASIAHACSLAGPRTELVRGLLLLWHDHLDASHEISQRIEDADGSFLHAIMHRREPDYSNSKYWWRRVGDHQAFDTISTRVGELLNQTDAGKLAEQLLPDGKWDAFAFVDACEKAESSGDEARAKLLRELQKIEFEVLLEFFVRH